MSDVDFERRLQVAAPFIQQANAMAYGLPRLLEDVDLSTTMYASVDDETHLLIAMREGLSGQSHGDRSTDSGKYEIPNKGFFKHIDTMIHAGLWTPDENVVYPSVDRIVEDGVIGLQIPSLSNEKVTFAEGEKEATAIFVAGATFDGMWSRINTAIELLDAGSAAHEIVILTGPRATEEREGVSGRYKSFDPEGSERPISELFPTEYDSAKALVVGLLDAEQLDPYLDETAEGLEMRGGEAGMLYRARRNGRQLLIRIRNGMPVVERDALNRPKNIANPRIPVTLEEFIQDYDISKGVWSYISSYPHRNRIAIEGIKKVHELGMLNHITIHPQGKMSAPDKVSANLIMGEVLPIMQNTRELVKALGLPISLLVSTTAAAKRYIETGH